MTPLPGVMFGSARAKQLEQCRPGLLAGERRVTDSFAAAVECNLNI